jgi:hypothetical protein
MSKSKGYHPKKGKSRKNAKLPKADRDFIRDHGKLYYDLTYGIDRSDSGTGGGVQTPRHDGSNDKQPYDWRDHEGEY